MSSSLSARDSQLGAGLLLLAIGIGMVEVRMNATWSKGVLFVVVLVPFVVLLAMALRSRTGVAEDADEDGNPSALTSLLCALAFAYGGGGRVPLRDDPRAPRHAATRRHAGLDARADHGDRVDARQPAPLGDGDLRDADLVVGARVRDVRLAVRLRPRRVELPLRRDRAPRHLRARRAVDPPVAAAGVGSVRGRRVAAGADGDDRVRARPRPSRAPADGLRRGLPEGAVRLACRDPARRLRARRGVGDAQGSGPRLRRRRGARVLGHDRRRAREERVDRRLAAGAADRRRARARVRRHRHAEQPLHADRPPRDVGRRRTDPRRSAC